MRILTVSQEHYRIIQRMHTKSLKRVYDNINCGKEKRFGEITFDEAIELMKQISLEMGERVFHGRVRLMP
jgi:hypothetical protein